MKRIVVFCDGTWNTVSTSTNVLMLAQSVLPRDAAGVEQVIFYDEGVGTSYLVNKTIETHLAGALAGC